MSSKNLIKRLVSPLVLASVLAFGNPIKEAKADDFHHRGHHNPHIYHHDSHPHLGDYYFFNPYPYPQVSYHGIHHGIHHDNSAPHLGLHVIDSSLRFLLYSQLIEESRQRELYYRNRENRNNRNFDMIRVDPDKIPQTFIANCWKDFDRDGNIKGISSELIGLNKRTFTDDENLIYGVYLPLDDIKGRSYNFRLFDKNGSLVNSFSGRFEKDREFRYCSFDSKNLSKILDRHGEGTYSVAFYFDGKHWNTKDFGLLRTDYDKSFFEKYGQRKFQEKPAPTPIPKKPDLSPTPKPSELVPVPKKPASTPIPIPSPTPKKSISSPSPKPSEIATKRFPDNFVFSVYQCWNDEDKDGLIDHNAGELLGWGLDQYSLTDKVTLTVSGFDNVKGKKGHYGIKSLDGKIIYDENFVFNEDESSFLHTFSPGELKPGKYTAYSYLSVGDEEFKLDKKIEILEVKNKNTTDLQVTKEQTPIMPTEEPENYKNSDIIFRQTKPQNIYVKEVKYY